MLHGVGGRETLKDIWQEEQLRRQKSEIMKCGAPSQADGSFLVAGGLWEICSVIRLQW